MCVCPPICKEKRYTELDLTVIHAIERGSVRRMGDFLIRLARLGGYLNRARDSPPGIIVLWRGMARLTDIHMGFSLREMWVIERFTHRSPCVRSSRLGQRTVRRVAAMLRIIQDDLRGPRVAADSKF